jgi:undecaprenol kinase/diacylglycerol kinase (ATP)
MNGLKIAWTEEFNFKIEFACAIAVILLSRMLIIPRAEFALVVLTIGVVLAVEALNTALEELCDKFQPNHDPHIGKIKDLAAAAVLVTSICAFFVGLIIFLPHL